MNLSIPNNIDAEISVLGSMFLSIDALEKSVEELEETEFYLDAHQKIFNVMASLHEKKSAVDITTVSNELEKQKWLKQVGGIEYLTEIITKVASARNIDEYIGIVREKAILRRLITEANNIATSAYSGDEIGNILDSAEKKILNVVKTRKGTEFRSIQDVLFKTQSDLEILSQKRGEITGLATGFYDFDKLTSGLHPNELIIVAARPGMGKSAFALNVACNAAINSKKSVAVFNMEMGAEQLAMRMLSSIGQIDLNKLKTGRLENNDWKKVNEAISRLADTKMYLDDSAGITVSDIRAKCRRLSASPDGLDLVVIDYLQLISGSNKYGSNRQQEVAEISRSLKTMAMELSIPVIALAQLSRSVEGRDDKKPLLSDLRESGSIEQDADIVSFLYREDYYNRDKAIDASTGQAEFIIAKHRNGPTKTIELIFKGNTSTFVNYVSEES